MPDPKRRLRREYDQLLAIVDAQTAASRGDERVIEDLVRAQEAIRRRMDELVEIGAFE